MLAGKKCQLADCCCGQCSACSLRAVVMVMKGAVSGGTSGTPLLLCGCRRIQSFGRDIERLHVSARTPACTERTKKPANCLINESVGSPS